MTDRWRWALGVVLVLLLAGAWWLAGEEAPSEEIESAQAALTAWGLFAGDGDLGQLRETFAEGPQLAQLQGESIEPGLPYTFALSESSVAAPGLVLGKVTVSRPGETVQTFRWEIELRRDDGRWKLWTVRTAR